MRSRVLSTFALLSLMVSAAVLSARQEPMKSGPPVGADLPGPFHPYNLTGDRKGKFHCLVCNHGLDPAVLIFAPVGESSEPFVKLIEGVDAAAAKYPKSRLEGYVVFLGDEVLADDKREAMAAKVATLAKVNEKKVVLALDKSAGPEGYKLLESYITVLIYDRHKVLANFALEKSPSEKDVQAILKEVDRLASRNK